MNDAEFQKLLNAEPPIVVIGNRNKFILHFLGSVLFVLGAAIVLFMKPNIALYEALMCVAAIIFFGFCAIDNIRTVRSPEAYALILDKESFTLKGIKDNPTYAWKDVSEFVTDRIRGTPIDKQIDLTANIAGQNPRIPISAVASPKIVFFNGGNNKTAAENRSFFGYDNLLTAMYGGFNAEKLAQLMNHWRERALKNG